MRTNKFLLIALAFLLVAGVAGAAVEIFDDGVQIDRTERVNIVGGPVVTKSGNKVLVTFTALEISGVNDYSAGAGALPITAPVIALTTGGAEALTLADGVEGQYLLIKMVSDGGDGTLTPANLLDGTTITFDGTDSVELIFLGASWAVIGTPTATVA